MANQTEAVNGLARLRSLPVGWDYGTGGPISLRAFRTASSILDIMSRLGATSFDVAPGDGDGAIIVAYAGQKSAEIHCLSNGTYELLHESADGSEDLRLRLSLFDLILALEGYGWRSPRFYASCTRSAMHRESKDTLVWLSAIPPKVESPLYVPIVWPNGGWSHANTSASFTTNRPAVSRRSSGEYRSHPFQKALA